MRARKSRFRIFATLLAHGWLRKTGVLKTQISAQERMNPGKDRAKPDLEGALATFQAYLDQLGVTADSLSGAKVLEIGPGVHQAVALQFVAAGARQVICVDKFVPLLFTGYHAQLYRLLRARLSTEQRNRFDDAVDIEAGTFNSERILHVHGEIERLRPIVRESTMDLIVSAAALEEIYNVEAAIDRMGALLRPSGYMVHKIDFRDYGLFSNHGYSQFEFLTIPEWIYKAMAEATGQPNRRLIDAYRSKFDTLGYETRFSELTLYGVSEEEAVEIRARLLPRFRRMATEDLLVSSAFLVSRKPVS